MFDKFVSSALEHSIRLPRSGEELASLLGCSSFDFFWSGINTNHGFWKSGTYGYPVFTASGELSFGQIANVVGAFAASGSVWASNSNCLLTSNKSFAFIVFARSVSDATIGDAGRFQQDTGVYPIVRMQPYNVGGYWLWYTSTSDMVVPTNGEAFSNSGTCVVLLGGWDARTKKGWAINNGTKYQTSNTVTGAWGTSNDIAHVKYENGDIALLQMGVISGADAEAIADNAVAKKAVLDSLLTRSRTVSNSNSISVVQTSDSATLVSLANNALVSRSGLVVHPAITNLMPRYYSLIGWTASELTVSNWQSLDSSGIRSLSKIAETTANDEHSATIAVTPLATGRHFFECTVRMSSIAALAIIIDNGAVTVGATSFDVAGAKTDYVEEVLTATITQIGSLLYRVRIPMDLVSTDNLNITLWGLALSGEDWVNYYVGSASKFAYVGQWSLIRSELPPVAIPVSLGSAATCIATVTDWTNTKAINRLKNGRISADVSIIMETWPEADVCLWSWRKDVNNGVEVWLRYDSTDGLQIIFSLSLIVTAAGTPTETVLTGDNGWVMQSELGYCSKLRLSILIDSAGLVKWWARSDSGQSIVWYYIGEEEVHPIITDDSFLRGQNQLTGYTAPVPTSIRFGSDLDGTGQQHMTISEVAVW